MFTLTFNKLLSLLPLKYLYQLTKKNASIEIEGAYLLLPLSMIPQTLVIDLCKPLNIQLPPGNSLNDYKECYIVVKTTIRILYNHLKIIYKIT